MGDRAPDPPWRVGSTPVYPPALSPARRRPRGGKFGSARENTFATSRYACGVSTRRRAGARSQAGMRSHACPHCPQLGDGLRPLVRYGRGWVMAPPARPAVSQPAGERGCEAGMVRGGVFGTCAVLSRGRPEAAGPVWARGGAFATPVVSRPGGSWGARGRVGEGWGVCYGGGGLSRAMTGRLRVWCGEVGQCWWVVA